MPDNSHARIRQLEDEIEILKDALADRAVMLPPEWKLSAREAEVFRIMIKRNVTRIATFMAALYSDRLDPPEDKIVSVYIFKMRRKLKPFGIEIRAVRGVGYALDERTRERFKEKAAA